METTQLKSLEQLKAELTAPLPAEAVTAHPTKSFLSSIKPIYVTARLNDVFGTGKWSNPCDVIDVNKETGNIVVYMSLIVPDYNIALYSFGGNDNGGADKKGFDFGDAFKGAHTDALTKIGSFLGIGEAVFQGKVTPQVARPPKPTPQSQTKPEATKTTATPSKKVEASTAQTGTPAAGIAPNEAFNEPTQPVKGQTKPELSEADKRAALLKYLNGVGAAKVLAHLLKVEKLKYVSVADFVAAEPIERIKAVYEAVRPPKTK